MKNKFFKASILFFVFLFGFFVESCEIGLGEFVDTEPPELVILSPEVDAIIRDSFAIRGTWSDDGDIKSLSAKLERTDKYGRAIELPGEIQYNELNKKSGTWKVLVNPAEQHIIDGSYQVTLTIKDNGGHTTKQSQTYTIDNTQPILVLQRPSSKSTANSSSVDSYGKTFTLTGQAADDNNVSSLRVNFYSDSACTNLIHYVDRTNIPPTIELDIAEFIEGELNDYAKIYGSTSKEGEKKLYCSFVVYDGAQKYPIEGNQSDADKLGNSTNTYYLYEDIATSVLGRCKITDVYHMYNGTYSLKNDSRSPDISNDIRNSLNQNENHFGCFTLNPANNPTFSVAGREQLKKDGTDFTTGENNISNDSDLIIEVAVGLDAIPLKSDTLKVYLQKCNDNGVPVTTEKYYPLTSNKTKSGTSYKFVTHIKKDELVDGNGSPVTVNFGDKFIIGVEGKDEKENAVVAAGKGYGIKLAASGAAPILEVKSVLNPTASTTDADFTDNVQFSVARYKDNLASVKENSIIRLKGSTQVEEGQPDFRILIDNVAISGVTLTPDASIAGLFTFEKDISTSQFANPSVSAQHTIKIESEQNLKSIATLTITYDVDAPTVKINSLTPVAYKYVDEAGTKEIENGKEKKYLNGKINVDIRLSDSGRSGIVIEENATPKLEFIQGGVVKATKYITDTTGQEFTNFDTTTLVDGPVTLKITAKDDAGNTTILEDSYSVLQSTDYPVMLPKTAIDMTLDSAYSPTGEEGHRKNLFAANQTISLRFIDDDGIKSVSYVCKNSSNDIVKSVSYGENEIHKSTDYQFDVSAPEASGEYTVTIGATDINNLSCASKTFKIRVTAAAPTVQSRIEGTNKASGSSTATKKALTAIVNITSDQTPFKIFRTVKKTSGDESVPDTVIQNKLQIKSGYNSSVFTDNGEDTDINATLRFDVSSIIGSTSGGNDTSGVYTVTYTVEDKNGNSGTSIPVTFYVDNKAPTVLDTEAKPITVPNVEQTQLSSFKFEGYAEDGNTSEAFQSGVDKVEIYFTNGSATSVPSGATYIEAVGAGNWNKEIVFENYSNAGSFFATEGEKKIWVRAIDAVGNKGTQWKNKTFIYDKAKPSVGITKFTPDSTYINITGESFETKGEFILKGTASDSNGIKRIELYQGTNLIAVQYGNPENGEWEVENLPRASNFSITLPSTEAPLGLTGTSSVVSGEYTYKVKVYDVVDKYVEKTVTAKIDIDAPSVTITTPAAGGNKGLNSINSTSFIFRGTSEDNTSGYASGLHKIWYKILEGKEADLTAPEAPSANAIADASWTGFTAASGLDSWNIPETFKEYTAAETDPGFKEGTYTIFVYAVDKAGNVSAAKSVEFDVDMKEPVVTTQIGNTDFTDLTTNETQTKTEDYSIRYKVVESYGFEDEYPKLTIKKDNTVITTGYTTSTSGDWTTISFASQADGLYEYTIEAKDKVGKTTKVVRNVRLDTTPPVLSFIAPDFDSYQNSINVKVNGSSEDASGTNAVWYAYGVDQAPLMPSADEDAKDPSKWENWTKASGTTSWKITGIAVGGEDTGAGDGLTGVEGTPKYLFVAAVDENGLVSSVYSKTIKVDVNIPTLSLTDDSSLITNTTFKLEGYVFDANGISSVSINDGTNSYTPGIKAESPSSSYADAKANASRAEWEKEFAITTTRNGTPVTNQLADGTYSFTVTATDDAEKTNVKTRDVIIDTTKPTFTSKGVNEGTGEDSFGAKYKTTVGTGSSATVWYTNNQIPVKAVVSDLNISTVEYSLDATNYSPLSLVTSSATGTATGTVSCPEGTSTITFKATDKAGNYATSAITVNVDTIAPAITTTWGDNSALDSSVIYTKTAAGYSIKYKVVEANGFTTGYPKLTIKKNDTVITTGYTTSTSGDWTTISFASQADGLYEYTIEAKDIVGKTTEVTRNVRLDTTPPDVQVLSPSFVEEDGTTVSYQSKKTFEVSGSSEDDSGTDAVYYKVSDSATAPSTSNWTGWTKATGTTSWKIASVTGREKADCTGEQQPVVYLHISAVDKNGKISTVQTKTIKVDTEAPKSTTDESSLLTKTNFTLTGTVYDKNGISSVIISDGTNTYTPTVSSGTYATALSSSSKATWTKTIDASTYTTDGTYTFTITTTDTAGKKTEKTKEVIIDKTAPTFTAGETKVNEGTGENSFGAKYKKNIGTAEAPNIWYTNSQIPVTTSATDANGISLIEYSLDATNFNPLSLTTTVNSGTATGSISCPEGTSTITLKATDKAGNTSTTTLSVKVDTKAPDIPTQWWYNNTEGSTVREILTNKNSAIDLYIVASDSGTGIKKISKGSSSVTSTSSYTPSGATEAIDVYKLTIATADISNSVCSIEIEDKVGNKYTWQPFSFNIDTTAPKSEIKIPASTTINGTLDITGVVTEINPKSISLYYSTATSAPTVSPTTANSGWTLVTGATKTVGTGGVTASDINNFTFENINVNTLSGANSAANKQHVLHLLAFATDEAGNECAIGNSSTVKSVKTYTVDMDADRPVIKFTNMTLDTGMTTSNPTGFENTELTGNITDDDGIPTTVKYKFGTSGTYGTSGLTYNTTDGTFTLNLSDGEKDIYFQITDLVGTVFESKVDGTYHLNSPKLTDKLNNHYGYIDQTSTDLNTVLSITVDTMPPEVDSIKYSRDGETYATSIPAPESFGGTKKVLYLQHYAWDTNDVKRSYFTIPVKAEDGNPNVHTSWSNVTNNVTTTIFTTNSTPAANARYYKLSDLSDNVSTQTITSVTSSGGKVTSITVGGKTYTKDSYVFSLTQGDEDPARENWYLWTTETPITIENMATSIRSCSLMVSDGIKQAKSVINLNIDYTKPVITFNGPSSSTTSSGSVTAYGSVDSKATVEYAISTSGTVKPSSTTTVSTWNKINQDGTTTAKTLTNSITTKSMYGYKPISNANISWFVYFDNDTTATGTHEKLLKDYLVNYGITTEADLARTDSPFEDIVQLYVWIRATDEVGNIEETCTEVKFDPQGDKPTVTYSYPAENDNGMTLGGEIRLSGSATDLLGSTNEKIGVESVWAQIISSNHSYGTWTGSTFGTYTVGTTEGASDYNKVTSFSLTKADLDYMKNAGYHVYNMKTYHSESTHTEYNGTIASGYTASDYAAKLTLASSSWSAQINGHKEFDVSSGTNGVAIRVYAQDKDGKFSVAKDKYVVFDAQNPVIGNRQRLYLIQSADNSITGTLTNSGALGIDFGATSSVEYHEDMFVRGTWWLIGSVEDNDTIDILKINGDELVSTTEELGTTLNTNANWKVVSSADSKTICFKYKLGTGSGVGNLDFNIYVQDAASPTPGSTTKPMKLSYDNKAPVLTGAEDSSYNINPKIKQSDGFYTFGSKVSEPVEASVSQSGLDYVAFYFLRRNTSSTTEVDSIYNPMLSSGNSTTISASTILMSAATASTADGTVVYDSGLYWTKQAVTRTDDLNVLGLTTNDNIRVNGLVKIGGAIYKITAKDASSVTLNGNPPKTDTIAFFANAMVVDNTVQENGSTSKLANGYPATVSNDDGDGMVEYVKKSGATWTWSCDIVSRNIPDGPIELHYVAFDAAGNYSIGIAGNRGQSEFVNATTLAATPDRNEYRTLRGNTNRTSNVLYVDGADGKSYYNGDTTGSTITNTNLREAMFIRNNGPRLAGVKIWTDYNGDGSEQADEVKTKYYSEGQKIIGGVITKRAENVTDTLIVSGNDKDYTLVDGDTGSAYMTIRDSTTFTPEIVGGNGNLYYSYKIGNASAFRSGSSYKLTGNSEDEKFADGHVQVEPADYMQQDSGNSNYVQGHTEGSVVFNNFAGLVENSSNSAPTWFEYKIWDSTEGTTKYTDSLFATMRIALNVQYFDSVNPIVKIMPFYWYKNSSGVVTSSVPYDSTTKKYLGHIEFEDDLTSNIKELQISNTKLGNDPKVSGKIKIEGYAYDNIKLGSLTASFDGIDSIASESTITYSNSGWASKSSTTDNWSFTATDVYADATGHMAKWTLTVDTSKMDGVVGLDKVVTVTAKDARGANGGNVSDSSSTQTVKLAAVKWNSRDTTLKYYKDMSRKEEATNQNINNEETIVYANVYEYVWGNVKGETNSTSTYYTDIKCTTHPSTEEGSETKDNVKVYRKVPSKQWSDVTDSNATVYYKNETCTELVDDTVVGTDIVYTDLMTPYYKMDVVPYITGISTRLDSAYATNASVFNRSALGYYPVIKGDSITIKGFNLMKGSTAPSVKVNNKTATVTQSNVSQITCNIPDTNSGDIDIIVENIPTLNNLNANTIEGNTEPNGINNDILNDDRKVRVWQIKAELTDNTPIRYPSFTVGKDANQTVGFVFDYGGADVYAKKNNNYLHIGNCYTQWYDTCISIDTNGALYAGSQNGDCASAGSTNYSNYANYYFFPKASNNCVWGYNRGDTYGKAWENCYNGSVYNSTRVLNPKLESVVGTNAINIYSVYYDSTQDVVKFRYGTVGKNDRTVSDSLGDYSTNNNGSTTGYQVIAGSGASGNNNIASEGSKTNATRAGEYSALGVFTGSATGLTTNTAAVAWYDASSQRLLYSYNENPTTTDNVANWGVNTIVIDSDFAGWYVDMIVDNDGGVHIAYYGASNGDLKYAYLPTYKSTTPQIVTVDSYLSVGTNISIDISSEKKNVTKHNADGTTSTVSRYIPYISYYMSAFTKTKYSNKIAWLTGLNADGTIGQGVDNDKFTGKWEAMIVPTDSVPLDYSIGIGIKKNDGTNNNPILGYGTKTGLETAALY